jgi:hypothetical protein
MKNEIMSKSEVWGLIALFLGLVGYSTFMFYLLSKRSEGLNYFDDLSSFNYKMAYLICFLIFILRKLTKKYKSKLAFMPFLAGVLLSVMFFIVIL